MQIFQMRWGLGRADSETEIGSCLLVQIPTACHTPQGPGKAEAVEGTGGQGAGMAELHSHAHLCRHLSLSHGNKVGSRKQYEAPRCSRLQHAEAISDLCCSG